MRRLPVLALTVLLAGCELGGAGTAAKPTTAPASTTVPDVCRLVSDDVLADILGDVPAGAPTTLEREGEFYGRTCLWGDPTGPDGAVGVQVGVADETGHDMVRNRSLVLKPTFDLGSIPGAIGCMNVAVLPVGGMTGASVFVRNGGRSILVGVVGPRAGTPVAESVTKDVIVRLGALS